MISAPILTILIAAAVSFSSVVVVARSNVKRPEVQKDGVYRNLENSKISIEIYKQLAKGEQQSNILFSPVSLSGALGVVELGAKSETLRQISKAFDIQSDSKKLREKSSLGETYEFISKISSKNVTVKTTNRVFVDDQVKVFDDYKNALKVYTAEVQKVRFSTSPGQAVYEINKFHSPMRVVHDQAVTRSTSLVVTNTIAFDGDWHSQFHPGENELRPFYVTHHDYVQVEMMFQRGIFRYAYIEELTLHVVELPYAGKELSMIVMMPDNFDLPQVEKALAADRLDNWLSRLEYKTVEVVLPRFQLTMVNNMKDVLTNLGITHLFDADKCDLGGMSNKDKLKLDHMIHTTQIKIEPHGGRVEAERTEASRTHVDDVILVYTDHPFLMLLRSNPTPTSFAIPQLFAVGRFALPPGKIVYGRDEL